MGPLIKLALLGGIGGLASIMKQKGIDLKKKKVAKDIVKKKKKKYVPEWQTKPDTKKIKKQQERAKKSRKRFLDKLQDFMN